MESELYSNIQLYPRSKHSLVELRNNQIILCRKIFSLWYENVAEDRICERKHGGT